MITSKRDLFWPANWLNQQDITALKKVFVDCFKGISADDYFAKYFASDTAFKRALRLYYVGEKLVGYCLLTFEKSQNNVLIRASAGFYSEYRNGGNTLSFSMQQAFKYWLLHPWQKIYYADTMLSPAMYRAIAKRVAITYPSQDYPSDAAVLFREFNSSGDVSNVTQTQCLLSTGRSSNYSQKELANFASSNKKEISFYCNVNPGFSTGIALFVIMPVNLKQLALTILKRS